MEFSILKLNDISDKFHCKHELFSNSKRGRTAILIGFEYDTFDILLVAFFGGVSVN